MLGKKYLIERKKKGKRKYKIKLTCGRCKKDKFRVLIYSNRIEFVCDSCGYIETYFKEND